MYVVYGRVFLFMRQALLSGPAKITNIHIPFQYSPSGFLFLCRSNPWSTSPRRLNSDPALILPSLGSCELRSGSGDVHDRMPGVSREMCTEPYAPPCSYSNTSDWYLPSGPGLFIAQFSTCDRSGLRPEVRRTPLELSPN